jgi:hypothetical protein
VAHASAAGTIVDPDVPQDRKRIAADLAIIEALATRYVKVEAGVPDVGLGSDRAVSKCRPWV